MSNTEISQTYDIYVGKNVILTNWNGLKQHVKIVKNNKEKKMFRNNRNVIFTWYSLSNLCEHR